LYWRTTDRLFLRKSKSKVRSIYDIPAPAKLNLFLHVTGRRPDGHHLIESAFMLIDWMDLLHIERRNDGKIVRADMGGELPQDDLCVRSARALQQATHSGYGAEIILEKRIPMQSGMGGGSSDAASCLLALNRLWETHLPASRLAQIGLQLGADVPFFLRGQNAWVQGVGEVITPLRGECILPAADFAVVWPGVGLPTAKIFSSPLLKRNTKHTTMQSFAANHYEFGHNDLQEVAQALCPQVGEALTWLEGRGICARMTGSGSAVFGRMRHNAPIANVPHNWVVRQCKNLDEHPLMGLASD
jgi:4-diphosphocytidyl-2-C-methyl-D-erythritol kinase